MEKEQVTKREITVSGGLSVLFAFFLTVGWQMENGKEYIFRNAATYIFVLLFSCLFFVLILFCFRKMHDRSKTKVDRAESEKKRLPEFIGWAGMILCWIPVLLAGYPGFFCYDATYQFKEVANGVYDMHHPLLHTFLLGKTLTLSKAYLGGYEIGVLIFCVMQMMFITACFCGVIHFMRKRRVNKGLIYGAYIYYALYPTCVLFGLCTTKDSIFTACMTIHLVFLYEMLEDGENFFYKKYKPFLYVITAVLAMLFRNNGIYSYLLFLPLLLIFAKRVKKKAVLLALVSMTAALLFTKGLAVVFGAADNEGFKEMLSVPAQQLARTYDKKGEAFFSEEERQELYSFISKEDLERYNEKLADPVKANLRVGMNSTLPDFVFLWMRTGMRAPDIYADAVLMQTYQAWYPLTIPDGYCGENAKPRYRGSESCYFALEAEEPVQADSKLPKLLEVYEFISRHMTFDTVALIPLLFSVGTMFWILLYMLGYAVCYKRIGAAGMLSLILCLCVTCLLGPIVLVRYYLILFYAFPLVAASNKLV